MTFRGFVCILCGALSINGAVISQLSRDWKFPGIILCTLGALYIAVEILQIRKLFKGFDERTGVRPMSYSSFDYNSPYPHPTDTGYVRTNSFDF